MLARRRTVTLLAALVLLAGLPAPTAGADTRRTPVKCVATLDRTAADIDRPAQRRGRDHVLPGPPARRAGQLGVLCGRRSRRGDRARIAIALGWSSDTFGNPGSALWASYLTRLSTGQPYKGCEMAYGFAQPHPIAGVVGVAGLFLTYVSELFDEYLREVDG